MVRWRDGFGPVPHRRTAGLFHLGIVTFAVTGIKDETIRPWRYQISSAGAFKTSAVAASLSGKAGNSGKLQAHWYRSISLLVR